MSSRSSLIARLSGVRPCRSNLLHIFAALPWKPALESPPSSVSWPWIVRSTPPMRLIVRASRACAVWSLEMMRLPSPSTTASCKFLK